MSCEIKKIANLLDLPEVKNRLFGALASKLIDVPVDELPVQDILISLSPAGDILALAWNTRVVILISKWDSLEPDDVKNKFHILWDGEIEYKHKITSILCLPLVAQGKASVGTGIDWTCLAVGLDSGFIRFYTETGVLLLEEQLHNESILGIKCQSLSAPRHSGESQSSEEIYVLYNSVICLLQGFPLFSTLKACRNYMARVKANCNDRQQMTSLVCKKLGFKNQDVANDAEVVGMTTVNTFDHLMTASLCGGFHTTYRSSAPQHNLVMATGKRPFIGFHYALEGGQAPVLSDVAIAMANKVASAIGSAVPWFRGNSKSSVQEKPKGSVNEPAEAMMCRFALSDIFREGNSVLMSPNKMLSVVMDSLGRVILIDNRQGMALRMWKGYRDAQCGWIEANEEKQRISRKERKTNPGLVSNTQMRRALFLVIYAPKKGLIDIWSIQNGTKITSFSASKNGRLLYTNYGLSGLNDVILSTSNRAQYPCVFIDPLGGMKEIIVPFHFALTSQNGDRARDLHLFKKLKTFIREVEYEEETFINMIRNICLDLKTDEIRLQVIEMLINYKNSTPDALLTAIECFSQIFEKNNEDLQSTAKNLYQIISQLKKVVEFYKYLLIQFDQPPKYNTVAGDRIPDAKMLSSILLTFEREINRILKLSNTVKEIKLPEIRSKTKVSFKEDGRRLYDFLSSFQFGTAGILCLKKDLSLEKKCQTAELFYKGWLYSDDSIEKWREAAKKSDIHPLAMMQFALLYWLHKKRGAPLEVELVRFTKLLRAICSIPDVNEICGDYNEISSWWKEARKILTEASNPFHALTAALVCRAVGMRLENNLVFSNIDDNGNANVDNNSSGREKKVDNGNAGESENEKKESRNIGNLKGDDSQEKDFSSSPEDETHSSLSEWENVSKDTCQFSLLIANLEDITILNAIVSQQPPSDHSTPYYTLPYEANYISLGYVLSSGKGSISEIVAKWLSSAGLDPTRLIDTTDIEFEHIHSIKDSMQRIDSLDEACAVELKQQDRDKLLSLAVEVGSEAKDDQTALSYVIDKISLLKKHFPYSLTSSVLLANLCWEYVMFWCKDINNLEALEAALGILRQIPRKRMQQGVCSLLWTLHIKERLEAASKLMNKLGKLPKERLCVQDIGISDIQLTKFLDHCVTFFDIFLDAEVVEAENRSIVQSEELWEGCPSGPQPFAALAISQPFAWYDLIMLHLQLANVLVMMAHFNLKVTKPVNNLFDSIAQRYFFQNITDESVIVSYQDKKRDNFRLDFLCSVISSSMELIHQESKMENNLSSKEAMHWMNKCQMLASIWKINNDELRIHHACALYSNNFDRLAEEVIIAVNDTEKLASKLLPIAGGRLMTYLSKAPDLLEEISRINPALTTYLQSLVWSSPNTMSIKSSNTDTIELVRCISRLTTEEHCDYHIAQMMLDAMFIFEGKT
ncbi:rab3 GTPase-activating protein non-catalytic subunit [Leptopilina boulardi]|uniref:rab3 GTPase-activating protein non-catalytic subunit n=1 Tax=Leptopilina boulardi TaxID=63433 RepID=UPI0021F64131|nr:rab3 GTPase-activating protein non-catalytic subunit [Leptopilina boulardi]